MKKKQKLIIYWYIVFTLYCIVQFIYAYIIGNPDSKSFSLLVIVPFIHAAIVLVCYIPNRYNYNINYDFIPELKYIKTNYPEIWKKLRPYQDETIIDQWNDSKFIFGHLDDGKDEKLNMIKTKFFLDGLFVFYPFLLGILIWIFSIRFIALN